MENLLRKSHHELQIVCNIYIYQQYQVPVREATVTITMMGADTDKKMWQGWTTERMSGGLSGLDVKKSVRNIFKESGNAAP